MNRKSDINVESINGNTPLHRPANNIPKDAVKALPFAACSENCGAIGNLLNRRRLFIRLHVRRFMQWNLNRDVTIY